MKEMTILALGAALLAAPALMAGPTPAKAGGGFGFSIHKPGFSLHIGKHRRYRRHYGPRIHLRKHYRKRYHRRAGRCGYWKRKCARNWGYGGRSYRGCMRYHGCY